MFDRILAVPSPARSTTAAAVSSQVVSIPSTNVLMSLAKVGPCTFNQSGVSLFGSIEASTWEVRLMAILVTRPLPDGEATAAALRAKGFKVLLAPMLRFEPVAFQDDRDTQYGAVVVTSANALRAIEARLADSPLLKLPLFAVGEHTAQAARAAGFTKVVSAASDAAGLRDRIVASVKARAVKKTSP